MSALERPVFELLSLAGIALSMLAYLPQVVHLAREHCAAGEVHAPLASSARG